MRLVHVLVHKLYCIGNMFVQSGSDVSKPQKLIILLFREALAQNRVENTQIFLKIVGGIGFSDSKSCTVFVFTKSESGF